jgi:hypothetical protein
MHARLIAAFALVGALAAGSVAAAGERDFRAHAYVIRVPPAYGTKAGLAMARSDLLAWALLGAAGGLWLGVAAAIVRSGSARAPRRASPPCAPATRATRG